MCLGWGQLPFKIQSTIYPGSRSQSRNGLPLETPLKIILKIYLKNNVKLLYLKKVSKCTVDILGILIVRRTVPLRLI